MTQDLLQSGHDFS